MLRNWRHHSRLWRAVRRGYGAIKRGCRIAALPPLAYYQYVLKCRHYYSAKCLSRHSELPPFSERPFNKYLKRGASGRMKLRFASGMLDFMELSFTHDGLDLIYSGEREGMLLADIELKSGETARLKLMRSRFPREGDLGLYLFDAADALVYAITFSIVGKGQLLISGVQGPGPEHGAEMVKEMTKQMHGLRPKNLLLSAVYVIARQYNLSAIKGITDQTHIKSQHLRSSYNAFWEESGGQPDHCGWFDLPDSEPQRDVETVKSQHRSAFRKREALRAAAMANTARTLRWYSAPVTAIPTPDSYHAEDMASHGGQA
ncbi:DUF535 family protein [Shimwellia pseudoproteus]|uniref:DUF535 family protein n=1 Tax=Shimwellia pseudoproteus TaxID=570012 RepID=UPI0018EC0181|nr:DUF535 family protein [Shimwellia pseudoproteus]